MILLQWKGCYYLKDLEGFYAIKTVFLKDLDALEARRRCGLRDEQEKCFNCTRE